MLHISIKQDTYVLQDYDEMFAFKQFWCWVGIARELSCDEEQKEKSDHCPFHGGNGLSTERCPSLIYSVEGKRNICISPSSREVPSQRELKTAETSWICAIKSSLLQLAWQYLICKEFSLSTVSRTLKRIDFQLTKSLISNHVLLIACASSQSILK